MKHKVLLVTIDDTFTNSLQMYVPQIQEVPSNIAVPGGQPQSMRAISLVPTGKTFHPLDMEALRKLAILEGIDTFILTTEEPMGMPSFDEILAGSLQMPFLSGTVTEIEKKLDEVLAKGEVKWDEVILYSGITKFLESDIAKRVDLVLPASYSLEYHDTEYSPLKVIDMIEHSTT